jgi:hypothetical protein
MSDSEPFFQRPPTLKTDMSGSDEGATLVLMTQGIDRSGRVGLRNEQKLNALMMRMSAVESAVESLASSMTQLVAIGEARAARDAKVEDERAIWRAEVWRIAKPALVAIVASIVFKVGGESLFTIIYKIAA